MAGAGTNASRRVRPGTRPQTRGGERPVGAEEAKS